MALALTHYQWRLRYLKCLIYMALRNQLEWADTAMTFRDTCAYRMWWRESNTERGRGRMDQTE
eukprot:scaffold2107_cov192-Alexandrium_tamarense.AAC.75